MAVTEDDLNRLRTEVDARLSAISLDIVGALSGLADQNDRFNRMESRLDTIDRKMTEGFARHDARFDRQDARFDTLDRKMDDGFARLDGRIDTLDRKVERLSDRLDNRFGWQAALTATVGLLVLFGDPLRAVLGL